MPPKTLSRPEFAALMAVMLATVAFSVDAMLPALPAIAETLSPEAPNRAQLVVTSFILGMGLGTIVSGPLSDALGRKRVIVGGAVLYVAGAAAGAMAGSIEALLVARLVQGLGASGPRVVALAMVRDLYAGRQMAKLMSFVMMIFVLLPGIAPSLGAAIAAVAGWRGIFVAFVIFSVLSVLWLVLRQAETLPPERRRPFRPRTIGRGVVEVVTTRQVLLTMIAMALTFGMMFSTIVSAQPIFDETLGRGTTFPYWFGGIALLSGAGSLLNAALVERLGMRVIVRATLGLQIVISGLMVVAMASGLLQGTTLFVAILIWFTTIFFQGGLSIGNLNALAMEPMGHMAGLTASIVGAVSTVAAVLIAAPVGLAFDGTALPLALGTLCLASAASGVMALLPSPDEAVPTNGHRGI